MPAAGNPVAVLTIDPQNVDYLLKGDFKLFLDIECLLISLFTVNFKNYLKGPKFNKSLGEILGNGIFNANGEKWKYQRKTASHMFNVKNFRDEFTE